MAEGGEGEEEIQFLRTVSPANLYLPGRPNLRDDEEISEGYITRKINSSELGDNLTRVCQFQPLQFQPGLLSADGLFLQRP